MGEKRDTSAWAQFMRRAQNGDGAAYRDLLNGILPRVRGVIRCYVKDATMAEDVCQEVLLKIHRARHTYDPSKPFSPWLGSVTRNAIFDFLRRKRLDSRFEFSHDADGAPSREISVDATLIVRGALAKLSETHRSAVEMVYLDGLSLKEAASRLGIGLDAMKARASRAYRALAEILLAEDEERADS